LRRVVALVATPSASPPAAIAAAAVLAVLAVSLFVVVVGGLLRLRAQQRLTVRHGNLVIVGMDFAEGQKTVTVPAIFDESSLEGGFDACHPRQIDVSLELLLVL
jgi:hypothetical protein